MQKLTTLAQGRIVSLVHARNQVVHLQKALALLVGILDALTVEARCPGRECNVL